MYCFCNNSFIKTCSCLYLILYIHAWNDPEFIDFTENLNPPIAHLSLYDLLPR